jgi:hypothetical protein
VVVGVGRLAKLRTEGLVSELTTPRTRRYLQLFNLEEEDDNKEGTHR